MEKIKIYAVPWHGKKPVAEFIPVGEANLCGDPEVPHITKLMFDRLFWEAHRKRPDSVCFDLFVEDGRKVHYGTGKCYIY